VMFDFAAIVLFVPVALGVMHLLRERAPMAAHVGTGLVLIGLLSAAAMVGASLVYWQMATGDPVQMAALMDRVNGTAGSVIPLSILSLGIPLGTLITAWALYRTRIAHWSTAACIAVGVVVLFAGSLATETTLLVIGAAIMLVGFASLGRMVLAETDEEWEHPVDFHGFGLASR
jgi:hypothetical protein